jgi:hypothetical protein
LGLKIKAVLTDSGVQLCAFQVELDRAIPVVRSSTTCLWMCNACLHKVWYLHHCWLLPLEIVMALGMLYKVVGMAWIAALAAACLTLLLNTPIEKCQEKYQDKVMEAKDECMKATAEALCNMCVLKLQAWEKK